MAGTREMWAAGSGRKRPPSSVAFIERELPLFRQQVKESTGRVSLRCVVGEFGRWPMRADGPGSTLQWSLAHPCLVYRRRC